MECKKAASRCNFAAVIYLIVASIAIEILVIVIGFVMSALGFNFSEILKNDLYYNIILWSLQVLGMYIISYPVFHALTKHLPRRDLSEKTRLGFGEFIKVLIAMEGLMMIGSMAAGTVEDLINEFLGITVEDTTSELIGSTNIWIVVLVVVVIGPIFEELIFRKAFVDSIGKYNSRLAIFISGASFALFHGNITQAIYTFAVGLMLAWVYTKTKNILYPIILHMLLNFFGTVPSLLVMESYDRISGMTDEELATSTDPTVMMDLMKVNAVSLMTLGFMFVGGIILLIMIFSGDFKLDRSDEVKMPFIWKLRTLIFNRGTLVFIIFSIITILVNLFLPVINQYLEGMGI